SIEVAFAGKSDIVCLPELFPVMNVGKDEVVARAKEIQEMSLEWAQRRSTDGCAYLVVPTLEQVGDHLYNTTFLLDSRGKIVGQYRKTHLAPEEENFFGVDAPGDSYPVFATDFGHIAIMTCMDLHYPE